MQKIGLTGGIGSGKTTVSEIFSALGIPVFNSDEEAKKLYIRNRNVRNSIIELIGAKAYDEEDSPNFKYIGEQIFADRNLLSAVNNLIHPIVEKEFEQWCDKQKNAPYVLKEAAILFETGAYKKLNATIVVSAPEQIRIERVMRRSGQSQESIALRMKQQFAVDDAIKKANFHIVNDEKQALIPQVLAIHEKLLKSEPVAA
jgi:dephospho-CoA kinase